MPGQIIDTTTIYTKLPCGIDRTFTCQKSLKLFQKLHDKKCDKCRGCNNITQTVDVYGKQEHIMQVAPIAVDNLHQEINLFTLS